MKCVMYSVSFVVCWAQCAVCIGTELGNYICVPERVNPGATLTTHIML